VFQAFDSGGKQPLGPDELSMVHGVLKDYCRERSVELTCQEAQDAAKELLGWFHLGVTDSARLRELLNSRSD